MLPFHNKERQARHHSAYSQKAYPCAQIPIASRRTPGECRSHAQKPPLPEQTLEGTAPHPIPETFLTGNHTDPPGRLIVSPAVKRPSPSGNRRAASVPLRRARDKGKANDKCSDPGIQSTPFEPDCDSASGHPTCARASCPRTKLFPAAACRSYTRTCA